MSDPSVLRALEQKVAAAQAELARLQAQESATYNEQRQVNAQIRAIRAQIQDPNVPDSQKSALAAQGAALEARYNQLEQQGQALARQVQQQQAVVAAAESELRAAQQASASTSSSAQATQSSGQTTAEQQQANAEGADPQAPNPAPQIIDPSGSISPSTGSVTTNAFRSGEQEDAGTDAPVRTAPNVQSSPVAAPGGIDTVNTAVSSPNVSRDDAGRIGSGSTANGASPSRSVGAAAPGDDQFNAVKTQINTYFGGPSQIVEPQANVLDKFASYTYSISLYIMNIEQYRQILRTKRVNLAGNQLLIQSGGAPSTTQGTVGTTIDPTSGTVTTSGGTVPGRSQFFPLDFYIDDVRLKSLISGKATSGAHNVFEIGFKIIEPNGISLLDNLYAAAQQFAAAGNNKKQNYAAQFYLMAIRFYGYDAQGNLLTAEGQVQNVDGILGPKAVVEKFVPFVFSEIKFRIANRLTEYECKGFAPQNIVNTGQGRGIIPYNSEISGSTLKELLIGKSSGDQVPPTVIGLCDALNAYQEEQKKSGQQEYADVYEIEILDKVMQDAKTQPPVVPGTPTNYRSTAMTPQTTAAEQKDGKKQNAKSQTKNAQIVAGTSIVRFIDQTIRNSSYIYDQQIKIPTVDPKTGKLIDIPSGGAADVLAWYRIGTEAEPMAYDYKRNDYAYKIKYQISLYQVNGVKSEYFPTSVFGGAHKKYNYWFTGENNSVISLEQDFNYLYYIVINGSRKPKDRTSDYREVEKYLSQTRSNQSDQGQPGMVNEAGANAADYLYSPADQSRIKMTIVGDPAWLQQGELALGFSGTGLYTKPFLDDGTINFERQEVLFEVAFNKPVDYDLSTGLMDPGQKNYEANRAAGEAGSARQSYIYKAVEVTSVFSRGKFTQDLEGVLVMFPIKPKNTPSATSFDSFRSGSDEDADTSATSNTDTTSRTSPIISTATSPTLSGLTFSGTGGQMGFPTTPTGQFLQAQAAPFTQVNPVATLLPQTAPLPPTSAGQVVGLNPGASTTTNYQTGGVTEQPVSATVVLKSGTARTVTSSAEVNELFTQGLITAQSAGTAIYTLEGKTAAQQAPVTSDSAQLTGGRDP